MNSVYENRHGKPWAIFNLIEKSLIMDDDDDNDEMQKVLLGILC